jgi:hypothetical protein
MSKPEGYVGKLSITWENGEQNVFEISQSQSNIWIGEHKVHPQNEKTFKGILREIGEVFGESHKIKSYNWIELVSALKYPNY